MQTESLDLGPYTILLVDDVEFSRSIVAHMLEGMGRPRVYKCTNGKEALECLRRNPEIDLVISDFRMPVLNGVRLLKAIRCGEAGVESSLPFAMLTGYSDQDLVEVAMSLDVSAFLIKPVSKKTMSSRLRRMLEATGDEQDPADTDRYQNTALVPPKPRKHKNATQLESLVSGDIEMRDVARAGEEAAKRILAQRAAAERASVNKTSYDTAEIEEMVRQATTVMRHLSCLKGQYDSDLGRSVTGNVTKLVSESGGETATNVVGYLNRMVAENVVAASDVNSILSESPQGPAAKASHDPKADFVPLEQVPPDRALKDGVKTSDGTTILNKGTSLTRHIVSILNNLQRLGMLALESRDNIHGIAIEPKAKSDGKVTRITIPAPPPQPAFTFKQESRVPVSSLKAGELVTRGVFSTTGTLYVGEGTELTKRMVSLLQDLDSLGRLSGGVWVERDPTKSD